ncbi:MAG: hypothetical protein LBQ48_03100 [Oscillospiraceae bacterium]|nr:hypothetical protein [Oscillospiraceae bacterium]
MRIIVFYWRKVQTQWFGVSFTEKVTKSEFLKNTGRLLWLAVKIIVIAYALYNATAGGGVLYQGF